MNLLFFTSSNNEPTKRLQRVIEAIFQEENIEIHRTIESLSQRLCQLPNKPSIAILLVTSQEELLDILHIRKLFRDIRIVLILPDREESTVAKGHRLYPRFFSYIDSDFKEIAAVLNKMLDHKYDEDWMIVESAKDTFNCIATAPTSDK